MSVAGKDKAKAREGVSRDDDPTCAKQAMA